MSEHNGNGRYVTDHSDGHWLGRLSMAVAVSPRHPNVARDTLDEFIRSPLPSAELVRMLKQEMRRHERNPRT